TFMKLANCSVAAIFIALVVSPIYATPIQFLVVPNAQTSTVGNGIDFLAGSFPGIIEFQQDYGRGQFSVGRPLLISQFAFRLLPGSGSINATVSSFAIHMSTSPYAPNSNGGNTLVTGNLATNLGPDNTLV